MSRSLDFLFHEKESYYTQKLYDFRIRKNGLVFCYSQNYFSAATIMAYNVIKNYTLENLYIENINDKVFVELMSKFVENKYITPEDIHVILKINNCIPNLTDSRQSEWDLISFSKWIHLKKDQ